MIHENKAHCPTETETTSMCGTTELIRVSYPMKEHGVSPILRGIPNPKVPTLNKTGMGNILKPHVWEQKSKGAAMPLVFLVGSVYRR